MGLLEYIPDFCDIKICNELKPIIIGNNSNQLLFIFFLFFSDKMYVNEKIQKKIEELEENIQELKTLVIENNVQDNTTPQNRQALSTKVISCPKQTLSKSRQIYMGKKYQSTIQYSDLDRINDCKNLVITSSTLANINRKLYGKTIVQSIQVPGATLSQLVPVCTTELLPFQNIAMNILICCGLNDFIRDNDTVAGIMNKAKELKTHVKTLIPYSTVNFIPIPLAPKICCLPENPFTPRTNRVNDLLKYNDYLNFELSESTHSLSLQDEGVIPIKEGGSKVWEFTNQNGEKKLIITGRKHNISLWREKDWHEAVHLHDILRTNFFNEKVVKYFVSNEF